MVFAFIFVFTIKTKTNESLLRNYSKTDILEHIIHLNILINNS